VSYKVVLWGSFKYAGQQLNLFLMQFKKLSQVFQIVRHGVHVRLVDLIATVGQDVAKEAVDLADRLVEAAVLGQQEVDVRLCQSLPVICRWLVH
jgi:hypothetical protein